jgi:LEA14-like dessication related protein
MNRLLSFIIAFLILILLAGCSLVKPLEFESVNSFKIEEKSVASGIAIATNVSLYNPNGFKFTINNADIDVIAEGVNLGKLQIPKKVIVNGKDIFSGDFRIELSFAQVVMAGKKVLSKFKSGKLHLQFKGTMDAEFLGFQKKFEVDFNEHIDLN